MAIYIARSVFLSVRYKASPPFSLESFFMVFTALKSAKFYLKQQDC
jgi:hypothetical protein